ncbi:RING/U-box protein [Tasmannia lanceolata]|uniref:RING/U-box protein n=1 Tax=Tasmannia lanceolata TaxID=3420 RepID=UPI0040647610
MELELNSNVNSEEAAFQIGDEIDAAAFENDRCGICMDLIIDRGVLDCCDHWFCFPCIDNWATITNLCPLCKNEFQLITCIPVYDTIGSIKVVEDSLSRDDDWCVQGKNNTLSFPSYYIDEDAVICLDGDGCKVRSALTTAEEDSTLDTSIACDSCDIWYHAFCVAFDAENTSENSWLCPRCIIDEVPQKSDAVTTQGLDEQQCGQEIGNLEHSFETAFSGKVSVTVADAGETALVVSMVEQKQRTKAGEGFLSEITLDYNKDEETGKSSYNFDASSAKLEMQLKESDFSSSIFVKDETASAFVRENVDNSEIAFDMSFHGTLGQPNIDPQEKSLALSLSLDASFFSPGDSFHQTNSVDKPLCKPSSSDGCKVSRPLLFDSFSAMSGSSERESNIDLDLGLCMGSSLPVDKMGSNVTDNQVGSGDTHQNNPSEASSLSVDKMAIDANENEVGDTHQKIQEVGSVKRKKTEKSRDGVHMSDCIGRKESDTDIKMEPEVPTKKARSDGMSQIFPLKRRIDTSASSDGPQRCSKLAAVSKNKTRHVPEKEITASEIISIVQEVDRRFSMGGSTCPSAAGESTEERDTTVGLRMKKIMRRVADDKESSLLVQKLRQEIREAVRDKASKDSGKNDTIDIKLLSAFRAAVARPTNEPVRKSSPPIVRAKKLMLQKGKIRENLTKKIYGTTGGKRRRAWDRDWEVEFWKHRCMKTKAEKVETLQSVLDLLKRGSGTCSESLEMKQEPKDSILSRLYLADTSVFPRKEDIKPLSALTELPVVGNNEQNTVQKLSNVSEKVSMPISRTSSQDRAPSSGNTAKNSNSPSFKGEASHRKAYPDGLTGGPTSILMSNGSKGSSQTTKENPGKSDDVKSDKRKWALEVLARKTALTSKDATQEKQEENTVLKRNYPLLVQLPTDMRPVLAPIHHSKVPVSVRQAQLYRLTEHYLRKANLPVIRRTADTELAVADAVNIEKEICNKSKSKLVYLNLCSQVLSQRTNNSKPTTLETDAPFPTTEPAEGAEQAVKKASFDFAETCENAEAALKLAGLLSDSPPSSPFRLKNDLDEKDEVREEGLENVFDIDSHPELDIYGDFEYDLEDEDYIGPSSMSNALRASKLQPDDGDSKIKVVLSTICEKTCNALDSKDDFIDHFNCKNEEATDDPDRLEIPEAQMDIPASKDKVTGSSILEVEMDSQCPPKKTFQGERDEEPSFAECEELYGPDKEPLVNRISDNVSKEPNKVMEKEATSEEIIPGEAENYRSDKAAVVSEFLTESCAENNLRGRFPVDHNSSGGENSPNHSLTSENAPRKEAKPNTKQQSDLCRSISRKVEAYIKEHIRPLSKSGVITVEQYRWAVRKTAEKVMKYHFKAKSANFLIKEGDKVKKLAEQYVEAAKEKI